MKTILIPGASLLVVVYVIMYLVDHPFWPASIFSKIRNIGMVLVALYVTYNVATIYVLKNEKEENALVYRVASFGKTVYVKITDHIRPFQKEFLTWLAVAGGLAFLGLVLMGIPGALFLEIPSRLGLVSPIEGDNAWPAAICLAILWPFTLPAGVLVKHYLIRQGYTNWALTGWIGTVVGGIALLTVMMYLMFGKKR